MTPVRYFIFALLALALASCKSPKDLAVVQHDEKPFIQLRSGRKIDSADFSLTSRARVPKAAAQRYGGAKNIGIYSDGSTHWGNGGRNWFYPQVMEGKLDVYERKEVSVSTGNGIGMSTTSTKYIFYFNKKGSGDVKRANFSNLRPIVLGNPPLQSKLRSWNIINKTTTVAQPLAFVAAIFGAYLLYEGATDSEKGRDPGSKLGTGAVVFVSCATLGSVIYFIKRSNARRLQDVLLRYDRDQNAYRKR